MAGYPSASFEPKMRNEVLFCPVASLPRLFRLSRDERIRRLQGCLEFSEKTGPGWIKYNPHKITVITANDSFKPMWEATPTAHVNKQIFRVKHLSDIPALYTTLMKPTLMCVTRRQHCATGSTVNGPAAEKISDNAFGFDIDFALIFPPGSLLNELAETFQNVWKMVKKGKRFCIMVDLKKVLRRITPTKQCDLSSLEFVTWYNGAFWITNFSKPYHSLMYVNNVFFWTFMCPYSWFLAAPYRIFRKAVCKDSYVDLSFCLKFTAEPDDLVLVHICFTNKILSPGEYGKTAQSFTPGTSKAKDLKLFFRKNSPVMSYPFNE